MGRYDKLYQHILMRQGDSNVSFASLCSLLKKLGFNTRVRGAHHIFWMEDVEEILNLQPNNSKAKAY